MIGENLTQLYTEKRCKKFVKKMARNERKIQCNKILLDDLNEFRKVVIDIYALADKDNDKTLYKSRNELQEFWEIID